MTVGIKSKIIPYIYGSIVGIFQHILSSLDSFYSNICADSDTYLAAEKSRQI